MTNSDQNPPITDSIKPVEPTEPKTPKKQKGRLFKNILTIAMGPIIALFLITFVFQTYQVSGMSMQNTLQDSDRLIVWKGSRSWARLIGSQYIPNRGDIIIVKQDDLSACNQPGTVIIKRVIGLPGDRVVYKDGAYTVYDSTHPNGFDPDTTLPYGKDNTALLSDPNSATVDVTLAKDQLFISGDHRGDSCDSRYFGPIEANQIIGKLAVRILPLSDAERF